MPLFRSRRAVRIARRRAARRLYGLSAVLVLAFGLTLGCRLLFAWLAR